jgi:hypothetical protein
MTFQSSFKQILNEKINSSETHPQGIPDYSATNLDLDPTHLAYLIGNIRTRCTSIPRGNYPTTKARPSNPPHNLSNLQRQSFEFVKSWIHDLSESFTERELRKAFRQAALILHPDQGGNEQSFLELKKHIDVLFEVIKK